MASIRPSAAANVPNDLEPYWMPFTPTALQEAAAHGRDGEGHALLHAGRPQTAGWLRRPVVHNAGHNRDRIVAAIQAQAAEMDYAPPFQFAHPKAFELAARLAALAPGDLDHVFFCNSGSEAVDTALKIALAFHNVQGRGSRVRLIGRERGYHGVGFGGIAVAASSTTVSSSARWSPASIICPRPIIAPAGLFDRSAGVGRSSRRRARRARCVT